MTAVEVFEITSQGGATDFAEVVAICQSLGPYCLIGGLAVNCYAEPVYTMDADLVLIPPQNQALIGRLSQSGFRVKNVPHSINAHRGGSQLRIQFTTDSRYADFPSRALQKVVLEQTVSVAALEDVFQGKLWAWADPERRLSKRKKDELDLIRLAEAWPGLRAKLPPELGGLFM